MRLRGYAIATERTYLTWIRRYINFIGKRHPAEVPPDEISRYLTYLAAKRDVSINTQKIVLNALVYLYQKFLKIEVGDLGFKHATRQRYLPVVLSPLEVRQIVDQLEGRNKLIIQLLYGSGLRVTECLRLRVQDVDLERFSLTVRDGNPEGPPDNPRADQHHQQHENQEPADNCSARPGRTGPLRHFPR